MSKAEIEAYDVFDKPPQAGPYTSIFFKRYQASRLSLTARPRTLRIVPRGTCRDGLPDTP